MHRRCSPSVLLSLTLLLLATPLVCAQDHPNSFWRPYAESSVRAGDDLERGQASLFLPVFQSQTNIVFTDLCGSWNDSEAAQGNFALGFRQMLVFDWIFGIHSSYDVRHTEVGNNFSRATLGLEMLNPNWGIRWNGYLAEDGPELIGSGTQAVLQDNNLFVQQSFESAYSGQEFEIESRLWSRNSPSDNAFSAFRSFLDMELWTAIGVFNYDTDAPGFGSMTGPRARVELRLFDIPLAGPDSRLVFAGQYEDDDQRGDVSSASMVVRIPFGRGTDYPRSRLRGLNRRMVAPLVRQKEIITRVASGGLDPALFTKNGLAISGVTQVDPSTAGPATAIATAGANGDGVNSLVLLSGDATGNVISAAGPIQLSSGQVLLGGGGGISVTGQNSNATAVFNAPGSRPTLESATGSVLDFVGADGSCVIGVDVQSSNASPAVNLDGSTGVQLQDVAINSTADGAAGVFVSNGSELDIEGSTIGTSGVGSPGLVVGDMALAGDNSFLALQDSLVFTSGAGSDGLLAESSAQVAVSQSVITTTDPLTGPVGVLARPTVGSDIMAVSVSSSTISTTGRAIFLDGSTGELNATVLSNQLLSPTGTNELEALANVGQINLNAQGNLLDPLVGTIRLDQVAGGDLNVSQSASGLGTANGVGPSNVLSSGTIDFQDAAAPLLPIRP